MRTITRWNVVYGPGFGAVVLPLRWERHSAAEHGLRPQASLNAQLVDQADIVIAIFWHRLGTATGDAESGTVEEIEEARKRGAYVGVLRCVRDVDPRAVDPTQAKNLSEYFERIRSESLMLAYEAEADLQELVDTILTRAVTRSATRAEAATDGPARRSDVWPRVESRQRPAQGAIGKMRTEWHLVLSNTGGEPAKRTRFELQAEKPGEQMPSVIGDSQELEALAPGSEARYALALHMGVAPQARCIVRWEDSDGAHENVATLRFF